MDGEVRMNGNEEAAPPTQPHQQPAHDTESPQQQEKKPVEKVKQKSKKDLLAVASSKVQAFSDDMKALATQFDEQGGLLSWYFRAKATVVKRNEECNKTYLAHVHLAHVDAYFDHKHQQYQDSRNKAAMDGKPSPPLPPLHCWSI